MSDARLNSVHLEAPRRQAFREARDALLGACSEQTFGAEPQLEAAAQPEAGADAAADGFLLVDGDSRYPLKIGINTIGRMPDNDIVLEDAFVSRRHCAIVVHPAEGCALHDVASKNGTFINGQKINGPTALRSGDEIRMCDKNLVFQARYPESDLAKLHTLHD